MRRVVVDAGVPRARNCAAVARSTAAQLRAWVLGLGLGLALAPLAASPLRAQASSLFPVIPVARSAAAAAFPGETFSMTLSSTVQSAPLTIHDSTAGGSQVYTGTVILTPTWLFFINRTVTIYSYVSSAFTTGSATMASTILQAAATGGTGSANGSWNAFGATVNGHASAVTLSTVNANGARRIQNGTTQQLTVSLRMNTTNTFVEAGKYTGVITFGARVQ